MPLFVADYTAAAGCFLPVMRIIVAPCCAVSVGMDFYTATGVAFCIGSSSVVMCCKILLISTDTFMPMVFPVTFPFVAIAVNMSCTEVAAHIATIVGDVIVKTNLEKTEAQNVVAAVVFDYRGFDTMGESFILLTAIAGSYVILSSSHSGKGKKKGGK